MELRRNEKSGQSGPDVAGRKSPQYRVLPKFTEIHLMTH
jgi:hypothetical protein